MPSSRLDFGLQTTSVSSLLGLSAQRNLGEILFIKLLSVVLDWKPTAIVIEQAQFFDESTWNLLARLQMFARSKIVIVLTMRPILKEVAHETKKKSFLRNVTREKQESSEVDLAKAANKNKMTMSHSHQYLPKNTHGIKFPLVNAGWAVLENANTRVIETHGMSKDDVGSFLAERLAIQSVPEDLVRIVFDLSSGSLQWCEEIVDYIKQRGGIEELSTQQLGESFGNPEMWIVQRMEKLDQHTQIVLKRAAIIGHDFPESLLAAIVPYVRRDREKWSVYIANTLQLLVENGFLRLLREHPQRVYEFKNIVTQQALYKGVPLR